MSRSINIQNRILQTFAPHLTRQVRKQGFPTTVKIIHLLDARYCALQYQWIQEYLDARGYQHSVSHWAPCLVETRTFPQVWNESTQLDYTGYELLCLDEEQRAFSTTAKNFWFNHKTRLLASNEPIAVNTLSLMKKHPEIPCADAIEILNLSLCDATHCRFIGNKTMIPSYIEMHGHVKWE